MNIVYFHPDIKIFADSLEQKTRVKIASTIRLLSTEGYRLSMPFCKKIESDLYELRILNPENIRIFYTFYNGEVVLLHVIRKKTQQLALNDLATARSRLRHLHS